MKTSPSLAAVGALLLVCRADAADNPFVAAGHALANGRAQDGVAAFGEAMTREPGSVNGHFQKALDWRGKQKWEHAMDELNAALALEPAHAPSLAMRAILQYELQKFDLAIADADAALKADPGNAFAHFVKARVFMMPDAFDPVRNRRELDETIKLDPKFATAYDHRAGAHRMSAEYEAGLADATKAIELEPNIYEHYVARIWILSLQNRWKEALPDCDQAVKLAPENAEVRLWQADARLFTGDAPGALAAADETIRIDRRGYYKPGGYVVRGRALNRLQRFGEARGAFDQVINFKPKRQEVRAGRAIARMMTGENEGALKDAQAMDSDSAWAIVRAWIFLGLARYEEAGKIARENLRPADWERPTMPYAVLIAAIADFGRGKTEEAQAVLAKAGSKLDANRWPAPVIAFLNGKLTADALLSAAKDNDAQTEAHAYIGIRADMEGRREAAVEHLGWVRDHGNSAFAEFIEALAILRRLQPAH